MEIKLYKVSNNKVSSLYNQNKVYIMLVILHFGRLGNAILQMINCISDNINEYHHRKIHIQLLKNQFPILKSFPIEYEFPEYEEGEIIKSTFWDKIHEPTSKQFIFIVETYIQPYIDYQIDSHIQWNTDLVIHIRSGDVFEKGFPFDCYVQPPFSFYEKIIRENIYRHI